MKPRRSMLFIPGANAAKMPSRSVKKIPPACWCITRYSIRSIGMWKPWCVLTRSIRRLASPIWRR